MSSWIIGALGYFVLLFNTVVFSAGVPQILHVGNGAEPKDLDPHVVTGVPEFHILENLFEPLVTKDPKTLEPIPAVAERWTISKDGKIFKFFLRNNAKWSNGEPVTAQDFVYSWRRLLTPAIASEYSYNGFFLKNGKAFNEGKLKDVAQLGVRALDSHTLEVELENATPFFLILLNHHSMFPVPEKTVEKFGRAWTRPENIVSNGPFAVKQWDTNKLIRMVKNPHYWDSANVKLETVFFYPTENLDSEEKMFRAKQLHVTNEVPLEKLPYWRNDRSGVFQSNAYLGNYYYRFNTTRKPLNDIRVRRALSLAIDRTKIVKYVAKGEELPAQTYTPPNTGGYTAKPVLPTDLSRLEEARKLLAEAGFPGGKGFPKLEILYNTHDGHKKIAEAIQQMWRDALGIELKLLNQEWKVYLDSMTTLNYDIARAGWIADYNDPNTFLDNWVTNGGNNRTGWSNKSYDSLVDLAGKELNQKKRFAIFQKAENVLLEELPIMPIYIYKKNFLKRVEVKGLHPNIEDIRPLKYVWLEDATARKVSGK